MRCSAFLLFVSALFLAVFYYQNSVAQAESSAETELATVCVDELCGYVNSQGQWHIPPKFAAADPFSKDGLAWVTVNDHNLDFIIKKDGVPEATRNGYKLESITQNDEWINGLTIWHKTKDNERHFLTIGERLDGIAIYTGRTEMSFHRMAHRKYTFKKHMEEASAS